MKRLYYLGCRTGDKGHFLWTRQWSGAGWGIPEMSDQLRGALDGVFCPAIEGVAMRSNVGPWRIVSWIDRSVDSRPGSHSTFVGIGYEREEEMVVDAVIQFPDVFQRPYTPKEFIS